MEEDDERHEGGGSARETDDSMLRIRPAVVDATAEPNAPVVLTNRSANALGYLTADLIMARLGTYDLAATKELILRDEGLVGLQDECAQRLVALEVLSLSHNKLTRLEGVQYLSNLIELNLNFNQITSLERLQCFGLEKLFLSNNRIVDISSLKPFTKLTTLSVYGNLILDLEATLSTCRSLPKLRSLDLGGNPCSQEAEGYKFQVVRLLPRLKTLDGDQLTQLDKDLAEEFVIQGRPATADVSRPSTATSIGSRPLTAASKPWETGAPPMTPSRGFDPFASKRMPRGNVRLFRDDFLNNNPILLEYLAQEAQASTSLEGDAVASEDPSSMQRSGGGFVEKMRTANPLEDAGSEAEVDDNHDDDGGGMSREPLLSSKRPGTSLTRPSTAGLSTGFGAVLTSNLGIDPSDPKSTIRKLLKHIEVLEESLASYKTRHVEASEWALLEENRRLQTENNNIPILQDEIASLKKQLSAATGLRPPAPVAPTANRADASRLHALEQENAQLRREAQRLQQRLKAHEVAASEPTKAASIDAGPLGANGTKEEDDSDVIMSKKPARLSDSTLLEESASIDVELTELILQNEVSLELIRNDIKNTKKEWEEQFQAAKARERERQRVRPQTSLGLVQASSTSGGSVDQLGELPATRKAAASVGKAEAGASAAAAAAAPSLRRGRQIHTSAGFRHDSGPEERLLHQSQPSAITSDANGRSVTNILTL